MIKSIRKRDGRLVDFEVDKIAGALYKAFSACFDKVELKKVYAIAHDVEKRLEEKESTLPTVELVQDTVEEILIEEGYVRVAKAYILYRDKRSRSRDMKSILLESIENDVYNFYIDYYRKQMSGVIQKKPTTLNDFLGLIKSADRIFTASYHGILFSIYFEKQFVFYTRAHKSRVLSLAEK
ncbi:MAG: hypothetical protein EGR78_09545, partial [Erysipelotrichaceae bacterium]|nr:hypothetical protein [Erysipelotrichaceae bacterium]